MPMKAMSRSLSGDAKEKVVSSIQKDAKMKKRGFLLVALLLFSFLGFACAQNEEDEPVNCLVPKEDLAELEEQSMLGDYPPLVVYNGRLYGPIDATKAFGEEDMLFLGEIKSAVPNNELPKAYSSCNDAALLGGKMYFSGEEGREVLYIKVEHGGETLYCKANYTGERVEMPESSPEEE